MFCTTMITAYEMLEVAGRAEVDTLQGALGRAEVGKLQGVQGRAEQYTQAGPCAREVRSGGIGQGAGECAPTHSCAVAEAGQRCAPP